MNNTNLIERQAAIDTLFEWEMTYDWDEHCREEDPKPAYIVSPSDVIEQLPSAQPSLLDALKIIEQFLQGCRDSLTCEIIAPNGMKLHTDWGYFEEGLEELRRYAERKDNG